MSDLLAQSSPGSRWGVVHLPLSLDYSHTTQVSQAMLTVTRLEDLTPSLVIKSIRANELPRVPMFADAIARTTSEFYDTEKSLPVAPAAPEEPSSFRRSQSAGTASRSGRPSM